jgi:hypothetical protein
MNVIVVVVVVVIIIIIIIIIIILYILTLYLDSVSRNGTTDFEVKQYIAETFDPFLVLRNVLKHGRRENNARTNCWI